MLLMALTVTAEEYELTFDKRMEVSGDPRCAVDFKTNSMNIITKEILNERQIKVSIWDHDLSQTTQEFTITIPQAYKFAKADPWGDREVFKVLGAIGGVLDAHDGPYVELAKNLFTDSNLYESIIMCYDNSDNRVNLFIDETSKILGIYEGKLGDFISGSIMNGGKILFEAKDNPDDPTGLVVVTSNTSGINSVMADNSSSFVSPNPSNGAASVEVSWDYTLLDDAQLNVVDMDGKLVHTQAIKSGNRKTNLSTSRFSTGTYIYIVHGSNGYTSTGKFVIN